MKQLMKRGFAGALALLCMVAAFALAAPSSQAQVTSTTYGTLTQVPGAVTNATTVSTNSGAIRVWKNQGVAILPAFTGLGASTANVTFTFNVSADGTNYTTTGPLTYVVALNGSTAVLGYKLFLPTDVNNVQYLRLSSIQNAATNGMTIQGITYSYSN